MGTATTIVFGRRTDTPPDVGRLRRARTVRTDWNNHQCWSIPGADGRPLHDRIGIEAGDVAWLTGERCAPAGDGWYVVEAGEDGNAIAAIGPFTDEPQDVMDALMALHARSGIDQETLRERLSSRVYRAIEKRIDAAAQELANALATPTRGAEERREARRKVRAAAAAAEGLVLATTS